MAQDFFATASREILPILIAAPAIYLWAAVIVPVLLRPAGIRLGIHLTGWRQSREEIAQLEARARLLVKTLVLGGGMVLGGTITRYVAWKYFGGRPSELTRDLVYGILFWSIVGAFLLQTKWHQEKPS
jgi:hypothetical protein